MSIIKNLFSSKVATLQAKVDQCEVEHNKLQRELDKLKASKPSDLVKQELLTKIKSVCEHLDRKIQYELRRTCHYRSECDRKPTFSSEFEKLVDGLIEAVKAEDK